MIKKLWAYLKKILFERWEENREIRKLERQGFLDSRKEAAYERGQKKAKRDPYERFRF